MLNNFQSVKISIFTYKYVFIQINFIRLMKNNKNHEFKRMVNGIISVF